MLLFTALLSTFFALAGIKQSERSAQMRAWERDALKTEIWQQQRRRELILQKSYVNSADNDPRLLPAIDSRIDALRGELKALDSHSRVEKESF
jgi:hypothetical protein